MNAADAQLIDRLEEKIDACGTLEEAQALAYDILTNLAGAMRGEGLPEQLLAFFRSNKEYKHVCIWFGPQSVIFGRLTACSPKTASLQAEHEHTFRLEDVVRFSVQY